MTRSFTLPMSHLQSSTSSPEGTDSLTAESSEIGVRLLDRVSELVEDLGVHPASSDRTVESAKKVTDQLELSIVIPCLNESDTVAVVVAKAVRALQELRVEGEVIVADNGSTDGSQTLARQAGAKVIQVLEKGYGAALMGGIFQARGRFVIMGDADDSYDFTKIQPFYQKLLDGADLVQGCRLPSGGGQVMAGAMPPLHRWLGNPALFRKAWQQSLDQRCTGMEFATEMIIKTTLFRGIISEVPITLHPDGRVHSRSHLRTFRDGWRTLRFFMLLSPRWTFLIPGAILAFIGLLLCAMAIPQWSVGTAALDVHTLLVGTLSILVASQMGWCAVLAKTFAITEGILPHDRLLERFSRIMNLERLLVLSLAMVGVGVALIGAVATGWAVGGFGALEYARTMRMVIPGAGLVALGSQFAASSFLMSVLRMARL